MIKIRTKLVIIATILYSGILISLAAYGFFDFWNSFSEIHKARISRHMDRVADRLQYVVPAAGLYDLSFAAAIPAVELDSIFYQLYDSERRLCSTESPVFRHSSINMPAMFAGEPLLIEYNRRHFICFCGRVMIQGKMFYLAAAAVSPLAEEDYYKHKFWILFGVPLYIILIMGISYFLAGVSLRPIAKIIESVRQITATNLHARLEVKEPKDELNALAVTLNDMIARLEQSFESQKNFIANAAHEMKTPLTIIKGRLELIAARAADAGLAEELNAVNDEADRLGKLVQSLLILARLDAGNSLPAEEIVRPDELLLDIVKKYTPAAGARNITMQLNIDDIYEMRGSSQETRIVFENIIDNAVKYSLDGKNIVISLTGLNDGRIYLSVKDSGPGIPFDDQPYIFSRFFRSDASRAGYPGSGLGLSIANEIVRKRGGKIEFSSTPGLGSTFTIILPI